MRICGNVGLRFVLQIISHSPRSYSLLRLKPAPHRNVERRRLCEQLRPQLRVAQRASILDAQRLELRLNLLVVIEPEHLRQLGHDRLELRLVEAQRLLQTLERRRDLRRVIVPRGAAANAAPPL